MPQESTRIVTLEQAAREAADARANGRTVVLANGIFDLFHVGHLRYLEGAAAEGDHLVVALNDDASARRHKGDGRPFVPADERAEIVAALRCVWRVTLFAEDAVVNVIRTLRPDVHAKGTDYTEDSVPEKDVTAEVGGRTAIVGDPKDHSTTDVLQTILDAHAR